MLAVDAVEQARSGHPGMPLGAAVIGRDLAELTKARDELRAMLKDDGPVPEAPFDGFEVLMPARDYKNRHASILLSIEATCEAVEKALQSTCAQNA